MADTARAVAATLRAIPARVSQLRLQRCFTSVASTAPHRARPRCKASAARLKPQGKTSKRTMKLIMKLIMKRFQKTFDMPSRPVDWPFHSSTRLMNSSSITW